MLLSTPFLCKKHANVFTFYRSRTGEHFTQPGHKTSDMTCTVIEQLLPAKDPFLRKRREKCWINKYQSVEHGAKTKG